MKQNYGCKVEKSGTGIERSGAGVEKSGTGIKKSGTRIRATVASIFLLLLGVLFFNPLALAVQTDGTGTSSADNPEDVYEVVLNSTPVVDSGDNATRSITLTGDTDRENREIVGSSSITESEDYALIVLNSSPVSGSDDGTSGEEMDAAWGIAEVALNENGADVIIYQFNEEGAPQEVGVYADVAIE